MAPEGGAHQSIITPSVGLEQPRCVAWEPAFSQDLEWTMLAALASLRRPGGTYAYFRLSTRPIDQALAAVPQAPEEREQRRKAVLGGSCKLCSAVESPSVTLVGGGAIMPEVLAAASELEAQGVGRDVVCLTSADLVFRAVQARQGLDPGSSDILDTLFPASRATPIVQYSTVIPTPRPSWPLSMPHRSPAWASTTSARSAMSATSTGTSASTKPPSLEPPGNSSTRAERSRRPLGKVVDPDTGEVVPLRSPPRGDGTRSFQPQFT